MPEGFVDALPFSVTVLRFGTVWFGPGLANGLLNDQLRLEKSKGRVRFTIIVNVLVLVTRLGAEGVPAGTGENCSVPWPGTTETLEVRLVTVAVTPESAPPVLLKTAV